MYNVRFNIVIYRYDIIIALALFLLAGGVTLSSSDDVRAVPPEQRYRYAIALTFDDGPHHQCTEQLLTLLRTERVRATFFVVGKQVIKYPNLLREIASDGHEIANHTMDHPNLSQLSAQEVRQQLKETNDVVESIIHRRMKYFRPPGGQYNEAMMATARELSMQMVLWTVFPKDHQETDPQVITERILAQAHDRGVVLLHSGVDATMTALPGVIRELKKRGYYFVTISHLRVSSSEGDLVWVR